MVVFATSGIPAARAVSAASSARARGSSAAACRVLDCAKQVGYAAASLLKFKRHRPPAPSTSSPHPSALTGGGVVDAGGMGGVR